MSFSENCFKNCSSSLFENDSCERYSLSSWMYHFMGKHVHPNINIDLQIPLELEILNSLFIVVVSGKYTSAPCLYMG